MRNPISFPIWAGNYLFSVSENFWSQFLKKLSSDLDPVVSFRIQFQWDCSFFLFLLLLQLCGCQRLQKKMLRGFPVSLKQVGCHKKRTFPVLVGKVGAHESIGFSSGFLHVSATNYFWNTHIFLGWVNYSGFENERREILLQISQTKFLPFLK